MFDHSASMSVSWPLSSSSRPRKHSEMMCGTKETTEEREIITLLVDLPECAPMASCSDCILLECLQSSVLKPLFALHPSDYLVPENGFLCDLIWSTLTPLAQKKAVTQIFFFLKDRRKGMQQFVGAGVNPYYSEEDVRRWESAHQSRKTRRHRQGFLSTP